MTARLPIPGSDDGSWGGVLNDFLKVAHNNNGTLKSSAVVSSGGILPGISHQTATVYQDCDLVANAYDLQQMSAGFDEADTTISGSNNGHLTADGVSVSLGQRIAVTSANNYGPATYNGIYKVTNTGGASAKYVLTRANDDMNNFIAVRITSGDSRTNSTVYFYPLSLPVSFGDTQIATQIASYGAHVEGLESNAFGDHAHSEGNAEANGEFSHAEGAATAEGVYSHAENAGWAKNDFSHAENSATAEADYSHAEGESTAWQKYMHSEGRSGRQFNRVVCHAYTINANSVILNDNSGEEHTIFFPDFYRTVIATVRVLARNLQNSTEVSAWQAQCIIVGNNEDDYRILGDSSFTLIAQDAGASTWVVEPINIDVEDRHFVNIKVTGEGVKYIGWEATIELDEIRNN